MDGGPASWRPDDEGAEAVEAPAEGAIGPQTVPGRKLEAVADEGRQRVPMARGVKQGLAKFFRRNGAKLEMAELSGSVLHLRDGNFDDDALPTRGDLRRIERHGNRPWRLAAIVAAFVTDAALAAGRHTYTGSVCW